MRFKIDENVSKRLAAVLTGAGHDVDTAEDESLCGHADRLVWETAQADQRLLITQDLDFSDARRLAGVHQGVLLVRLFNPSRCELIDRVGSLFLNEPVEDWRGCLVVLTHRGIRIRRAIGRPEPLPQAVPRSAPEQ